MSLRLTARAALAGIAAAALALTTAAPAGAAPRDPYYDKQWGPQQVRAEQAWRTSTGRGVVIAIVDSGVDLGHPELRSKLVPGATFVDGCRPSCGNGDWRGPDGEPDGDEHGTHVAGIAAAATGNGVGIAGVAPHAKIMPVKVLEEGSGSFTDVARGIRWAANHGADVINLSLGAVQGVQILVHGGLINDVQDAIRYANSRGVVVVAAAGNDAVPVCNTPAYDFGAMCVVATDKREAKAAYSSGGVDPELLTVSAPGGSVLPICGEDILSTVPRGTGRSTVCGYTRAYDEYAGTSMAAPHVAGVAALLVAQGRSLDNVYRVLTSTARQPRTQQRGVFTPVYGYGIVDARAAVAKPVR
jgi:subtilisin family serine protease